MNVRRLVPGMLVDSTSARRTLHVASWALLQPARKKRWIVGHRDKNQFGPLSARMRRIWIATLPERSLQPDDDRALAVLIPVGPRDVEIAPLAVEGVRRNLLDRVTSIEVVTTPDLVEPLSKRLQGVTVIDESTILPPSEADALAHHLASERAAWYLQQILKLRYCLHNDSRFVAVVDADTVLTRPQRLRTRLGNVVIVQASYHHPYFDHLGRLLPNTFRRPLFATTAHVTVYDQSLLKELVQEVECVHAGKSWATAICELVDPRQDSGFSEGEFYGQWWCSDILKLRRYTDSTT